MTREEAVMLFNEMKSEQNRQMLNELCDMAIRALEKPNYESDTEVRLAVVNRYKRRVVLFDPFGEEEYLPAGDLVRCKDCKRYESDGGALMTCTLTDMIVDDDCYCWWAERRE